MESLFYTKKTMEELNRLDTDSFRKAQKFPIAIVLDEVRSMHNVGATFRTADSFAVNSIYLSGLTPKPPHRDIHKTALGSENSVEWHYTEKTVDAVSKLKKDGYKIVAIEQVHNSISLDNHTVVPNEKIAFVFGNEVSGVNDDVLALCEQAIEIPQYGTKHSLNISVTVGIIIWDTIKKFITHGL